MVEKHGAGAVCALLKKRTQRDGLRDEIDMARHLLGESRETTELRLTMRHSPRYRPLATLIEMAVGRSLTPSDMTLICESWSDGKAWID